DFLERSRSIVASMTELVGDLLELARLESGTIDLELGPFSIAEAGGRGAAAPCESGRAWGRARSTWSSGRSRSPRQAARSPQACSRSRSAATSGSRPRAPPRLRAPPGSRRRRGRRL